MKFNSFGLYPSYFLKTLTKLKKCYIRHIFSCEIEHRLYNTENFDPFTKSAVIFHRTFSSDGILWITAKKPLLLLFGFYKR